MCEPAGETSGRLFHLTGMALLMPWMPAIKKPCREDTKKFRQG
jgi:hypothetical protein